MGADDFSRRLPFTSSTYRLQPVVVEFISGIVMRLICLFSLCLPFVLFVSQTGCADPAVPQIPAKAAKKSWYEKYNWKPELYFSDPKVIALCNAIEANDIQEIDRLVAEGADVKAIGKGNMTPLLWAFPGNKPERFKRLLEHGADPNVVMQSDFNTNQKAVFIGRSVTHMACNTWFPNFFEYVFLHGGDPNLPQASQLGSGNTPLLCVISGMANDKKAKVQRLIELKVDLNHESATWNFPARLAVGRARFDIALLLLKAGANPRNYSSGGDNSVLIHQLAMQDFEISRYSPQQKKDYEAVLKWLEDHGESIEDARADLRRWRSWSGSSGEYRRNMDREIAERKARIKRELEEAKVEKNPSVRKVFQNP